MPEPIEGFPSGATGRFWKYDWSQWSDGRVWKFTRDELDSTYLVTIPVFVNAARARARQHGQRIRARQLDGGAAVGIQFIPGPADTTDPVGGNPEASPESITA
jgi:hypothetical protein